MIVPTLRRSRLLAAPLALALAVAALVVTYGAGPARAAGPCTATPTTTTCTFGAGTTAWRVPDAVTEVTVDAFGAQGGGAWFLGGDGGLGGEATATMAVTPGETLQVNVGGQGAGSQASGAGGAGGYNGGGVGGSGPCCNGQGGTGGGGASDVRRDLDASSAFTLDERLLVAGGGGGRGGAACCSYPSSTGGAGGGTVGETGDGTAGYATGGGGGGGTDVAGGSGGTGGLGEGSGTAGSLGAGGRAGDGPGPNYSGGGGGGGGYYGGGGGGGGWAGYGGTGGGGGGSGFGPDGSELTSGVRSGSGLVTITYATPPDPTAPTLSVGHTPDGANGWSTTSPTTFNVAASDSGSGLDGTPTCTDGATALTLTPSGDGTWTAAVSGEGTHAVSCSVSDIMGNTTSATDTAKIDSQGPTMRCTATPSVLRTSANNHKLVPVTVSVAVTDTGSGTDPVTTNRFGLVSVASNQADSGLAVEDVAGDAQGWIIGTSDTSGQVRTERYGADRVYTLTYRGHDQAGNTSTCQATVTARKG